ncbi:phosphatidylethanolamine N-methyltransferase isoform X2 [Choloepus didactylus]|uniref:phosphatidylethanolamine N-methyltransferase isoform X2 n=1 Tax=Choloepus didactylus TaxID=27675 RepID=UPI00189E6524|nr:phosphatidylethanolamine N-methyltransferase isoform X2 [Choloepus didactylus]
MTCVAEPFFTHIRPLGFYGGLQNPHPNTGPLSPLLSPRSASAHGSLWLPARRPPRGPTRLTEPPHFISSSTSLHGSSLCWPRGAWSSRLVPAADPCVMTRLLGYVDPWEPSFVAAVLTIAFNPLFWNVLQLSVARLSWNLSVPPADTESVSDLPTAGSAEVAVPILLYPERRERPRLGNRHTVTRPREGARVSLGTGLIVPCWAGWPPRTPSSRPRDGERQVQPCQPCGDSEASSGRE